MFFIALPPKDEYDIIDNQGREWHFEHRLNYTDANTPFDDGYISLDSETPDIDKITSFVNGCDWK